MSADNYIYVRKRRLDGKFGVSMRFASCEYSEIPYDEVDEYGVFDTAQEAILAAHRACRDEAFVEYGVRVEDGLL